MLPLSIVAINSAAGRSPLAVLLLLPAAVPAAHGPRLQMFRATTKARMHAVSVAPLERMHYTVAPLPCRPAARHC